MVSRPTGRCKVKESIFKSVLCILHNQPRKKTYARNFFKCVRKTNERGCHHGTAKAYSARMVMGHCRDSPCLRRNETTGFSRKAVLWKHTVNDQPQFYCFPEYPATLWHAAGREWVQCSKKQCGLSGNASKEAYAETYSESDAHDGQTSRECNDDHSGHIVLDVINRTRESRFHRFCQHRFSPFPHCFPWCYKITTVLFVYVQQA